MQTAADPATVWTPPVVRYWYGELKRQIEITSGAAVWFHIAKPVVPIRWVIVRDPLGRFKTQVLLCVVHRSECLSASNRRVVHPKMAEGSHAP